MWRIVLLLVRMLGGRRGKFLEPSCFSSLRRKEEGKCGSMGTWSEIERLTHGYDRATSMADRLDLPFALIHKERARPNEVSRMTLVGNVAGKTAIIADDICDTAGMNYSPSPTYPFHLHLRPTHSAQL